MYELKQLTDRTYYIDSPSKIGLYCLNDDDICLIDSGNDSEAGKKILKILEEHDWTLKFIINTHSNADHIGGNAFLQEKTGCKIYTYGIETSFTNYPFLETSFLFGAYPFKDLQNKFLLARPSKATNLKEVVLPPGFKIINLPGHFFDMIGIETPDNVIFIGDAIVGSNIINKYHVTFIFDIDAYFKTLDYLETLEAKFFVTAHADISSDIRNLIMDNRNKVLEVIKVIKNICKIPLCFEDILQKLFNYYELDMGVNQYVLVGSTLRSYLSYLYDKDEMDFMFDNNKLIWKIK